MTEPLVSVVMPVSNVERFLAEAIESILAQTFREFEFIIVDFGSTDGSKSIMARYAAADIRVKLHEIPLCVLPIARNFGCSQARGRYIAVMDADDVSLPNRLRVQLDFMERSPEVALLGGAVEFINAVGKSLQVHRHPTEPFELRSEMRSHCTFWHPTVLMRSDAFRSVGGYRPAFKYAHDYDLELRLAEKFECANLFEVIVKYRFHPQQISLSRLNLQTLCVLAAQASASVRRNGRSDPLSDVAEITPAVLAQLGVSEAVQQSNLITYCRAWIHNMCHAGEIPEAINVLSAILQSFDWKFVDSRQIADLWLTAARLHWSQNHFLSSLGDVGHAVWVRPVVAGRPFRSFFQWMRLA